MNKSWSIIFSSVLTGTVDSVHSRHAIYGKGPLWPNNTNIAACDPEYACMHISPCFRVSTSRSFLLSLARCKKDLTEMYVKTLIKEPNSVTLRFPVHNWQTTTAVLHSRCESYVTDLCRAQSGRAAWDHYQYPLAGSLPTELHTISHFQTCACTCVSQDSTHNRAVWLLYDHRVWLSVSYHLRRLWFSYSSNSTILTILTVTSCWQEWESEGVSEGLCVWVRMCEWVMVWANEGVSDGVSKWGCEWVMVWASEGVSKWGCEQVRVWVSDGVSEWGCEWWCEQVRVWVMVWASEGVSDGVSKWGCEWWCERGAVWMSDGVSERVRMWVWVSDGVSEWWCERERVWRSEQVRMWVWVSDGVSERCEGVSKWGWCECEWVMVWGREGVKERLVLPSIDDVLISPAPPIPPIPPIPGRSSSSWNNYIQDS